MNSLSYGDDPAAVRGIDGPILDDLWRSRVGMEMRYWLVLPNGGRQLIDPRHFDIEDVARRARQFGAKLVVEGTSAHVPEAVVVQSARRPFEPPVEALGAIFRSRLQRIYFCAVEYSLDMNRRPTQRMLGGYYRRRGLVRVYTHDRLLGRRPIEELFDTFLHEIAHHLEYTEPASFDARTCGRVRGRMHSPLFWKILAFLKQRWAKAQAGEDIEPSDFAADTSDWDLEVETDPGLEHFE